jgi:hypothetical protein
VLLGSEGLSAALIPAWIYVFDLDSTAETSPNPISIKQIIGTDAEAVAFHALKVAPEIAVAGAGSADRVLTSIRQRLRQWWPLMAIAG